MAFKVLSVIFFALDAFVAFETEEWAFFRNVLDAEQMAERFSVEVHFDGFVRR